MLTIFLILPAFYLGLVEAGCDCTFNQDNGEVVCDPGTQEGLYWDLPECLDVPDDVVCSYPCTMYFFCANFLKKCSEMF